MTPLVNIIIVFYFFLTVVVAVDIVISIIKELLKKNKITRKEWVYWDLQKEILHVTTCPRNRMEIIYNSSKNKRMEYIGEL